jgi:group I intron endonuclease
MKGIYKITNSINNKIYIGRSLNIEKRWKQHKNPSTDYLINRAIKKYGIDNFIFEIIEEIREDNLLSDREVYWIHFYDSTDPLKGYNISKGGDAFFEGKHHTEESKLKIKKSMPIRTGENNPMFGVSAYKDKTEEDIKAIGKKISDKLKGMKAYYNPSTGENIRLNKDDKIPNNFIPGSGRHIKFSEESKIKMSESAKKRGAPSCAFRDKNGINNPMFGKKKSKESLEKAKETRLKNKKSIENKHAYHKDGEQKYFNDSEVPEDGWVLGCKKKPFTVTKKFSESMRNKCIKIQCIETGEIFTGYEEACQEVGLKSRGSICRSIKKGGTAGGFHWKKLILPI